MSETITAIIKSDDLHALIEDGTIVVQGGTGLHNDLPGLQGGQVDQFYHLTLADYQNILDDIWVLKAGDTMSGTLNMNDNLIDEVDALCFNLSNGQTPQEGKLFWNPEDGTLQVGLVGGTVNLQIGQELVFLARNDTLSTMTNGTAVVITGATGNRPDIQLAATTPQSTSGAIGLVTESIDANQNGYVTTYGLVRDLNTSAFSDGDRLFLSDTPGGLANVLPASANRKVFIGVCLRAHPTDGVILVSPINIFYPTELSGVQITNLQVGDALRWNGSVWVNQP